MKALPILIAALLMGSIITSCGEQTKNTDNVKTVKTDTVRKIHVQDGQAVKSGQLLAELNPPGYQIQLDVAGQRNECGGLDVKPPFIRL